MKFLPAQFMWKKRLPNGNLCTPWDDGYENPFDFVYDTAMEAAEDLSAMLEDELTFDDEREEMQQWVLVKTLPSVLGTAEEILEVRQRRLERKKNETV